MAQAVAVADKRYAVVTGANKGIGLEICRQLASKGIVVVLTARDENKGLEAVRNLTQSDLSDYVIFHQLDVTKPASVDALAEFITNQFGKLDILVNNAGVSGASIIDPVAFVRAAEMAGGWPGKEHVNWHELTAESYRMIEECLYTNYYGAKSMFEALYPLLRLSNSPRVVNVSSLLGSLQKIPSERVRSVLSNVENLTEGVIDELLNKYLMDFSRGMLEEEGWPTILSAYTMSKAALNAYTRMVVAAKQVVLLPGFLLVNCVCPGFVKTDITCNAGLLTPAEGAESVVKLALLPPAPGNPSGLFFYRDRVTSF